jgi:hypothetical protein
MEAIFAISPCRMTAESFSRARGREPLDPAFSLPRDPTETQPKNQILCILQKIKALRSN